MFILYIRSLRRFISLRAGLCHEHFLFAIKIGISIPHYLSTGPHEVCNCNLSVRILENQLHKSEIVKAH